MADFKVNKMPFFVAGFALIFELGSHIPWPLSGAVSAAMGTAMVLGLEGKLLLYPKLAPQIIKVKKELPLRPKTPEPEESETGTFRWTFRWNKSKIV